MSARRALEPERVGGILCWSLRAPVVCYFASIRRVSVLVSVFEGLVRAVYTRPTSSPRFSLWSDSEGISSPFGQPRGFPLKPRQKALKEAALKEAALKEATLKEAVSREAALQEVASWKATLKDVVSGPLSGCGDWQNKHCLGFSREAGPKI